MIVGDRAQRASGLRLLEEYRERTDEQHGDDRRRDVVLVDQDAAVEHLVEHHHRLARDAGVDFVDVASPQDLPETVEEVGDPERGHQQGHRILVDERAQHQPLDDDGERDHDEDGDEDRGP